MTDTTPHRSGGPRTPEGKRRSSLNAMKHGMDAVSPQAIEVLEEESGVKFIEVYLEMRDHFQPADPVEGHLVKRIARCLWRLSLGEAMENRVLSRRSGATKPSASYDRVLKYERLVDIHLHRALSALERKREHEATLDRRNELHPRSF